MELFFVRGGAFWLLGTLLLAALLYAAMRHHKNLVVSSLYLWRRALGNTPPQKISRPLLTLPMFLGLCALLCLIISAAIPILATSTNTTNNIALVIDNGTASSTRTPEGQTRLANYIERAKKHLSATAKISIITTSPVAQMLLKDGTAAEAIESLNSIRPVHKTGSLKIAVGLARQHSPLGQLVVASSKKLKNTTPNITMLRPNSPSANLGITRFDISPNKVFLSIKNYSTQVMNAELKLSVIESKQYLIDKQSVTISKESSVDVIMRPNVEFIQAMAEASVLHLELINPDDDLATDNHIYSTRINRLARRVAVFGKKNNAVFRALRAAGAEPIFSSNIELTEMQLDAAVFIGTTPTHLRPNLPTLVIAPEANFGTVSLGSSLQNQVITHVQDVYPTSPSKNFGPLEFSSTSTRTISSPGLLNIFESNMGVVGGEIKLNNAPCIVLGFNPEDTSWIRSPSFPVFITRVLEVFGSQKQDGGTLEFISVGEKPAKLLSWGSGNLRDANNNPIEREIQILRTGLYRHNTGKLAVNLLNEHESDNRIAKQQKEGGRAQELLAQKDTQQNWLSPFFAGLALMFLIAEYIVEETFGAR